MSPKIAKIIVALIVTILSLAIFANSMTKPIGHDEHMYCSAGVLLAQGKMIYRDFSYVAQMPYQPLLYAALYKIFNTTYYLLTGRILSSLCDIMVVICIVGIYRRIFGAFPITGLLLGLAAAVLFVFNPLVDYAAGFAWNHDIVILLVTVSLWLFISTDFEQEPKYWTSAVIGVLLTVATCMRITTVLVQLLFFTALLAESGKSTKQRFKTVLPFLIAAAFVWIWPILTITLGPRAFFLNLYWIPKLNSQLLHQIGMAHNKVYLIFIALTAPGYLVLVLLAFYLYLAIALKRQILQTTKSTKILLTALLPLIFFIIAIIPPTMWRQYLAIPVPFLAISLAYPLLHLRQLYEKSGRSAHFKIARSSVAICVVIAVVANPVVPGRIGMLFSLRKWVPIRLHKISEQIGEEIIEPKRILTLEPLLALEGGCDIYPEFSSGVFVYRIADQLSAWNREITHAVGPRELGRLIEDLPPSAVILGTEPEYLEAPLFEIAVKSDKEKWERKIYDGLIVYFRR
ncbi:MAG: hypothetical protein ACYS8Y_08745 [Planctomycetota bacterium]|jgi:hypothetical protein